MILSTIENIPNKEIAEIVGLVRGNTVRARNIGRDFLSGLKTIVGGEIGSYTQLMTESRNQAMERMIEEAKNLGADAIVGIRITTADVMQGSAEILIYGTAVKLK